MKRLRLIDLLVGTDSAVGFAPTVAIPTHHDNLALTRESFLFQIKVVKPPFHLLAMFAAIIINVIEG